MLKAQPVKSETRDDGNRAARLSCPVLGAQGVIIYLWGQTCCFRRGRGCVCKCMCVCMYVEEVKLPVLGKHSSVVKV